MRIVKGLCVGICLLLAVALAGSAFAEGSAAPTAPGAAATAAPAAPAAPAAAAPAAPVAPPAPPVDKGKMSYAVGSRIAMQVKNLMEVFDRDQLLKGFNDQLDSKVTISEEEVMAALKALQPIAMAKMQEMQKKAVDENTAEEQKFMAENGKAEGVVTLPSGLQYKEITKGTGAIPTANDRVKVNYVGKFVDGKEFDSSATQGRPAEFPVKGVIPAWTEALQKMPVGSKWMLFVPASLGYGSRGQGPKIPPAKMLVFEVELLEILAPPPAPEAAPGAVTIPPANGAAAAPAAPAAKPADAAKGSS